MVVWPCSVVNHYISQNIRDQGSQGIRAQGNIQGAEWPALRPTGAKGSLIGSRNQHCLSEAIILNFAVGVPQEVHGRCSRQQMSAPPKAGAAGWYPVNRV